MMKPGRVHGVLHIHSKIDHVQDGLQHGTDDPSPPGPPTTIKSLPSRVIIVGVIDDKGRLPGLIAFASP